MRNFCFGSWQIVSAAECGGNLAGVRWCGDDIMRGFSNLCQWEAAPTNYGLAVLFPPNRIADGTFQFRNRKYHLPLNEAERRNHLHGIALREKWKYGKSDENSINMFWEFSDDSPMYANYPFACRLSVTYTFDNSTMVQDFQIENLSDRVMPCALGFHSSFTIPKRVLIHGRGENIETVPPRYLISGREIPWEKGGFEPNKWIVPKNVWPFGHFRMDDKHLAVLDHEKFQVEYHLDKQFDHWMIWRPEHDKSFLCIEPMNIKVGCFENTPELLPILEPGARKNFISQIKIIPG